MNDNSRSSAASMVAEVSRICGSVGLHGGMTSYLNIWQICPLKAKNNSEIERVTKMDV